MNKIKIKTLGSLLLALASLALTALPAQCADDYYRAGEFSVATFGAVQTPDFEAEKLGAGLELGYSLTPRLVISAIGITYNLDGDSYFDQVHGRITYRIPVGQSAPYAFVGGGRELEQDLWEITVGIGVEHRFTKHFGIFADAALLKEVGDVHNSQPSALARAGLRLAF